MNDLTRRHLLGGLATGAVTALVARPTLAHPAPRIGGCRLCAGSRRAGLAPPRGMAVSSAGRIRVIRSSGDPETDHLLGRALVRLAVAFDVAPGFAFFDDGNSPNAFATDDTLLDQGRGTVLMGMHLFRQRMARDEDAGATVLAICAHEFGHIHQMQNGYGATLLRLDTTARPIELHADFLAGFHLALRKKDHPDIDLQTVGRVFDAMGDTDFTSPQHHGTSEERIAAITGGYAFGRAGAHSIDEAAAAGVQAIRRML